mmetsp:Transcript_13568/g.27104  ORF Transcript_13568/g.27104 Transcript_13568/m.27104 type:complete len:211 (-) Transcript_13568:224-856(-)
MSGSSAAFVALHVASSAIQWLFHSTAATRCNQAGLVPLHGHLFVLGSELVSGLSVIPSFLDFDFRAVPVDNTAVKAKELVRLGIVWGIHGVKGILVNHAPHTLVFRERREISFHGTLGQEVSRQLLVFSGNSLQCALDVVDELVHLLLTKLLVPAPAPSLRTALLRPYPGCRFHFPRPICVHFFRTQSRLLLQLVGNLLKEFFDIRISFG